MPRLDEIDRQAAVDALAGGDDAVDPLVEHGLDMELAEARIVLDIAQEHRDAVVDQRLRNAGHHRQREAAIGVVGEQADGEAALAQQALRQALGRKPSAAAVSRMRSRVSAVMRPWPLSAFEAVATLTPAAAATSRSVTGFKSDCLGESIISAANLRKRFLS